MTNNLVAMLVMVPRPMRARLKALAAVREVTLGALILKALSTIVDEHSTEPT